MRAFLALLISLMAIPCVLGQQKATVNCLNAKTVPLFDSAGESKIAGWIRCGTEISVISLLPNGEFYLVDAETTSGQTMRGNVAKFWLTTGFLPSTTPQATVDQSTGPAASSLPPTNSQPPPPAWEKIQTPSVIGSTYPISYPVTSAAMRARGVKAIHKTIHLYEEENQLIMDVGWPDRTHNSQSVEYRRVKLVRVVSSKSKTEHTVDIELPDGVQMVVPVQTDDAAHELAEYVAKQSPLYLELIGDAWRVRKHFSCPEIAQAGCGDFKELLYHDDADIVDAFYSGTEGAPHYACFSNASRRFFTLRYNLPGEYFKGGFFYQNIFIDGQSNSDSLVGIEWASDDYGKLLAPSASTRGGKQTTGYITQSELTYQHKFTNRNGTETQYSLSIRWSTGRYIETFSSKDDKGKPFSDEETGICVKLN